MFNLSFDSSDPCKSVITNSADGALLYQTETHGLTHRTTRIDKFTPETGFQPLAEIHFKMLLHPESVDYKGRTTPVSEFLTSRDGGRAFIAADNKEYLWKADDSMNLRLHDDSETMIAESHKHHYGVLHEAQNYNIDVSTDSLSILDDIFVAFVVEYSLAKQRSYELQAENVIVRVVKEVIEGVGVEMLEKTSEEIIQSMQ